MTLYCNPSYTCFYHITPILHGVKQTFNSHYKSLHIHLYTHFTRRKVVSVGTGRAFLFVGKENRPNFKYVYVSTSVPYNVLGANLHCILAPSTFHNCHTRSLIIGVIAHHQNFVLLYTNLPNYLYFNDCTFIIRDNNELYTMTGSHQHAINQSNSRNSTLF